MKVTMEMTKEEFGLLEKVISHKVREIWAWCAATKSSVRDNELESLKSVARALATAELDE